GAGRAGSAGRRSRPCGLAASTPTAGRSTPCARGVGPSGSRGAAAAPPARGARTRTDTGRSRQHDLLELRQHELLDRRVADDAPVPDLVAAAETLGAVEDALHSLPQD